MSARSRRPQTDTEIKKPDLGWFGIFLGAALAVLFFVLQANGVVEMNWLLSAIVYFAVICGVVWSFLTHAAPHKSRNTRAAGAILWILVIGALGSYGTFNQFRREYPREPLKNESTKEIPKPLLAVTSFLIEDRKDGGFTIRINYHNASPTISAIALDPEISVQNPNFTIIGDTGGEFEILPSQDGEFIWRSSFVGNDPVALSKIVGAMRSGKTHITINTHFRDEKHNWYAKRVVGKFVEGGFESIEAPPAEPSAAPERLTNQLKDLGISAPTAMDPELRKRLLKLYDEHMKRMETLENELGSVGVLIGDSTLTMEQRLRGEHAPTTAEIRQSIDNEQRAFTEGVKALIQAAATESSQKP